MTNSNQLYPNEMSLDAKLALLTNNLDITEQSNQISRQLMLSVALTTIKTSVDVNVRCVNENPKILLNESKNGLNTTLIKQLITTITSLKQPPRKYEKCFRDIVNILIYFTSHNIPHFFCKDSHFFHCPLVLLTTSKDIRNDILTERVSIENLLAIPHLSALVPLDNTESKNISTLKKNIPNYSNKPNSDKEQDNLTNNLAKIYLAIQDLPPQYLPTQEAIEISQQIATILSSHRTNS